MNHPLFSLGTSFGDFWNDFATRLAAFFQGVNWPRFVFILTFIILGSALVILVVTFIVNRKKDMAYLELLKEEKSTIRVYRINGPRNRVRFFNLSTISKVHTLSLEEFYADFPEKEQPRVKDWVGQILDGKQVPQYLQTDITLHHNGKIVPSFLRIAKSDPTKGLVHLESYLLRYGPVGRASGARHYSTEGDFAQAVKANGVQTGITFCFTLQPLRVGNVAYSESDIKAKITPEMSARFENAIAPFVKGNQKLIRASDSELIIANFDMLDTSQGINFALRVIASANQSLESQRKRHEPLFEVRGGIVSNKDLLGDSDAILTEARRAAMSAYDTTNSLSFFKKGSEDFDQSDLVNYRSEVERIIYEKRLVYSYRPVYNVEKRKVYGYLARTSPLNTSFASIEELKNYAVRAKDDKNLFAAIAKSLVPRFVSERGDPTLFLFYPVSMSERSLLVPFFAHFKDALTANLVFLFNENDVSVNLDAAGTERFKEMLDGIHDAGFSVAFLLNGNALLLEASLYAKADAFFVDFQATSDENNVDTKVRSELHALVEKLLKYQKPIIANSLMSWNAVDLVVASGLLYISSDVFAPYDAMFRPINDKNIERVRAMKERKITG